jgi:uncharacterized protein (TIGR02246 family)
MAPGPAWAHPWACSHPRTKEKPTCPHVLPRETHALLAAAFKAGDLDAFAAVYEENAVLLVPPEGERVNGRDEIRKALVAQFAVDPSAEIRVVEKLESDGLALTHARWRLAGTGPDGGRVELEGRGTIVSRKQPDGSWLIALDNPVSAD